MARQSENSTKAVFGHRAKDNENVGTPAKVSVDRSSTICSPRKIIKIAKNLVPPKRPTKSVLVKPIIKYSGKDARHSTKHLQSSRKTKLKHVRVREPAHDSDDLATAFQNSLEEARDHILQSGKEGFENARQKLDKMLAAGRVKDEAFFKKASNAVEILSAPMIDEKIETTVLKNGTRAVQVVEIGKRIVDFKKNIEKEEGKLADYWKQYEQLQLEFEEVGVQVFGAKTSRMDEDRYDQEGYRHEVDSLEMEHREKLEGLLEELEEIGDEAVKKMKASEKEIDLVAGKERSRLFLAFVQ